MENSTNILDLPTDPANGGGNIKISATEQQPQHIPDNTSNTSHMTLDQNTINQIVSGLQQASASGATQLASRDIPMTTSNIMQDQEVKPNYIPHHPRQNYIEDDIDPQVLMSNYNKNIERNGKLDNIYK
jgi:hypothetical protein